MLNRLANAALIYLFLWVGRSGKIDTYLILRSRSIDYHKKGL
ncbi:MAG: hypothetical protein ACRC62_15125 [Microcoleus sp.]